MLSQNSDGSQSAIVIQNLTVQYGNILALQDVDLQIASGDFVGIIGPNGSGKTSLLKSILGLVKPKSGHVSVLGMSPQEARSQMGYVPQTTNIDREFPITVREAVLMGRLVGRTGLFHRYDQADHTVVAHYLRRLEINELTDRQIGQLSGGQLKRVLIARALVVEPRILLLDEPTAGVDAHSSSEIYELLRDLNQSMTIVIVTHDTMAVSSYLKSIACINQNIFYHGGPNLSSDLIMKVYGCPVELIAHGVPHRVLEQHDQGDLRC
ncbi:MAG: ABC transporter ATP-binding protein [Syntrophomonadaceae bacterium]|nr:ABC transporter ATP-binding protein [Syntrophomonadaceae bacterium]